MFLAEALVQAPVAPSESTGVNGYLIYAIIIVLCAMFVYLARRDNQIVGIINQFTGAVQKISTEHDQRIDEITPLVKDTKTTIDHNHQAAMTIAAKIDTNTEKSVNLMNSLDIRFDGFKSQLTETQNTILATFEARFLAMQQAQQVMLAANEAYNKNMALMFADFKQVAQILRIMPPAGDPTESKPVDTPPSPAAVSAGEGGEPAKAAE